MEYLRTEVTRVRARLRLREQARKSEEIETRDSDRRPHVVDGVLLLLC